MSEIRIPWESHTLANGLRVVLSPDRSVPVVALNLWYGVGSRNEGPGRTGFAHLFEHMMFQGSAHIPKNRHFELVERAGGTVNATTWFDRTNYFETLPSHHLDLALWLESDRMGWMAEALTAEKLRNQQSVVVEEKKQRYDNQPYGDWDERLQARVFPEGHPYHHKVIGSMADIEAARLEDVRAFFRTFYVPNNAVLSLCGDFDPEHALARVEHWFGEIPAGDPPPALELNPEVPEVIGEPHREVVEGDVPLVRVYLAGRIPSFGDPRFHAAQAALGVLGRGRASRLYRGLVRGRRVAKDVGAYAFPMMSGAGMGLTWATGLPDTAPEALEADLVREVESLASVTPRELDRIVSLATTRFLSMTEEVGERADLLSMFATLFGDPGRINGELDRIRSVTVQDVRAFAETFLGPGNRVTLVYVPGGRDPGRGERAA